MKNFICIILIGFISFTLSIFILACKNNERQNIELSYSVIYEADENGTIKGEANQTVAYGESATTVEAVPNEGYVFVKWSDGITEAIRQDINVTADISVTAEFKVKIAEQIKEYTVTYQANEGGTINGIVNQTIKDGENGTEVTAVPNDGYKFIKWSDELTEVTRQDKNVTENITVNAIFEKLTYSVVYETDENGTIEGEANQTVTYGESATPVEAVPNEGYVFVKWSDGITEAIRQDINVTADISVTAEFKVKIAEQIKEYTVTYQANEGGTINGIANQTIKDGENGTEVTAVPNDGYKFIKWSDELTEVTRQDKNVTENISVNAIFEKITYSVVYATDGNGTIEGEVNQTIKDGENGTEVTAVPNDGYKFIKWSDELTEVTRQDKNVTENISVNAIFEKLTYSVVYATDGNGTIEGEANQTVTYGESATTVEAVPNKGYAFLKWSDDVTTAERTDINVTSDITVNAIFEKITYSVVYATDGNGTIEGEANQTVAYGESATTVEAVPNEGYVFVKWSDEVTTAERTDINVTSDITVNAIFEKLTYSLVYATDGNGTIEGEANQIVTYGESATKVEAVPNEGYIFVKWSDEVTTAERTDINVMSNIAVTALYEKIIFTVTYIASEGGEIEGFTEQEVEYGEDALFVIAVPLEGYKFVNWSDGNGSTIRRDEKIYNSITYTAEFEFLFNSGEGTVESPFTIASYTQLNDMWYYPSANYKLICDLDLCSLKHEPIFDDFNSFSGIFDGAYHSIKNLTIDTELNFPSLFGFINGGIVKDLKIIDIYVNTIDCSKELINTRYCVGTVAGVCYGLLLNINVTGIIEAEDLMYNYAAIGGLVGMGYGTVAFCYSNIQINVKNAQVYENSNMPYCIGGMIGVSDSAYIIDCISRGGVTVNISTGNVSVGGLVGYYFTSDDVYGKIESCETDIELVGDNYYIFGGFIGQLKCNSSLQVLNNCAHGDIKMGYSAGFIYRVDATGNNLIIENCFTDNNVSGYRIAAGFIAYYNGGSGESLIKNCYSKGNITACSSNEEILYGNAAGFGYQVRYCIIRNCNFEGTVKGEYVAGFVRNLTYSEIYCCYAQGFQFAKAAGSAFLYSVANSYIENCYSVQNEMNATGSVPIYCLAYLLQNTNIINYYYAGNAARNFIKILNSKSDIINCHVLGEREIIGENRVSSDLQIDVSVYTEVSDMFFIADLLNEGLDEEVWVNTENNLPVLKFQV